MKILRNISGIALFLVTILASSESAAFAPGDNLPLLPDITDRENINGFLQEFSIAEPVLGAPFSASPVFEHLPQIEKLDWSWINELRESLILTESSA